MGTLEESARSRARKQNVQHALLSVIGAAGILAVGMAAPNAVKLLDYSPLGRKRFLYQSKKTLSKLIERGDIKRETKNGKIFFRLTPSGKVRLARLAGSAAVKRPRKWDKRWRIVIFDIPEHRRKARDLLRSSLIAMGFQQLQHSVWIYPYDCEDLVTLLKTHFAVGKEVLYILSEDVEGDSALRRRFGLT